MNIFKRIKSVTNQRDRAEAALERIALYPLWGANPPSDEHRDLAFSVLSQNLKE